MVEILLNQLWMLVSALRTGSGESECLKNSFIVFRSLKFICIFNVNRKVGF